VCADRPSLACPIGSACPVPEPRGQGVPDRRDRDTLAFVPTGTVSSVRGMVRMTLTLACSVLLLVACAGTDDPVELKRLNADRIFGIAPPGGTIDRSVFPMSCAGSSDDSSAGNEVTFVFSDAPQVVSDFYRGQLSANDWQASGERVQASATAIDAVKEIEGETYHLTITIGSGGGGMFGTTPEGVC
jgi:hypothetical protein